MMPVGDPRVLVEALAKAAAAYAAAEADARKEGAPLTRADVEDIAERVAKRVLGDLFEIDVDAKAAKRALREDLAHARKGRTWWDKALAAIAGTAMAMLAAGLVTVVFKAVAAALVAYGQAPK